MCSASSPISDSQIPVPQHTEVNHANCQAQPSGLDLDSKVKRSLVYVEDTSSKGCTRCNETEKIAKYLNPIKKGKIITELWNVARIME